MLFFYLFINFAKATELDNELDRLSRNLDNSYFSKSNDCSTSKKINYDIEYLASIPQFSSNIAQLTLLSKSQSETLFHRVKNLPIPFSFIKDGCSARSLEISRFLDSQKIESARIFIQCEKCLSFSNEKVSQSGWSFHTANVVKVKDGVQITEMVIDPSLFPNGPVKPSEWVKALTKKWSSNIPVDIYYTNKFHYRPKDRFESRSTYSESELRQAKEELDRYSMQGTMDKK